MHILVVNDDGPPSQQSSPYVHSLVKALQASGHVVSVVLPHTQRSWIGKAHMVGQTVKPTYFRPGTLHKDDGATYSRPLPAGSSEQEEWVLVDGTPASCVQIGIYHYFHDRGPIDLVVSGPNYGRNSTAVFSLSSGTLGGALEAAVCKRKAIALSFAFFSMEIPKKIDSAHDPEIIAAATSLSTKLIQYLYDNWGADVDVYSVNVPLVEDVESRKIMWTNMLQNYWGHGSCFKEVEDDEGNADEEEQKIREGEDGASEEQEVTRHTHKHFKWAPRFVDVYKSVEAAPPGNDGWAIKQFYSSVTPLKANFMHANAQMEGELKLPIHRFSSRFAKSKSDHELGRQSENIQLNTLSPQPNLRHFYALIDYEDRYVKPLILNALKTRLPANSYILISSISELPNPTTPFLQIGAYESLPFEHIMTQPTTSLVNAYIIRKALIRKHYLSTTRHNWIAKNPSSILATNVKPACDFELDYAEFLDDALVEAWELKESFEKNEGKQSEDREWWILKPGMSDRGQGIRLFSTEEELQNIFEEWEADQPDSDEEEEEGTPEKPQGEEKDDYIVTSHLRHFVAQPYIHPPLLLPGPTGMPTKFHIRTYVLAIGSLKIYVYKPMLALFASTAYTPPWSSSDLSPHLTNTCLQTSSSSSSPDYNPVSAFWSLPLPESQKEDVFKQICETISELFIAAAKGMMIHFQTLPNAFEVFGVDFLVDGEGRSWLLEVNAFPDFGQTGEDLRGVVEGLWEGVMDRAVRPFFEENGETYEKGVGKGGGEGLVLVGEVELGRK
ncbi:survival protein sure-like phosphatase/nucleotidase [Amylocarpus encephaloides]|uniref:Survival protein sure-like phosphatase/nucleotidase n=1 Tax=Amylocarpus encephaloides TaxID=45428 RepID=A0A9P8C7L6_9HELO|nr:survival protein sure-like phosphatase/nucleotidase [Amylocarpus encephaloides]